MSLEDAFNFLYEFKSGNIALVMPMTSGHVENIGLLSRDLLVKNVDISSLSELELNGVLSEIASVDSHWNKSLQESLDQAYRLVDRKLLDDAAALLNSFTKACPSRFYGKIASDAKDEILGNE